VCPNAIENVWKEQCGRRWTDGHINKSEVLNMVAFSEQTVAVYVLDDDSSFLKSTRRLLDSAGYQVEAFTNPIAFLEDAAMHRPEVAVVDIRMPEMNGLEVQTRLRTVSPSTRVIILTSNNDPLVRVLAMNAGASAFFIKGVENKELLAGIKAASDSRN
jgi:two-component system response regulator FixJ